MFKVEKRPTIERVCPNGHTLLPDLLPGLSSSSTRVSTGGENSVGFCHVCGASIEELQTTYDAAFCANCNNPVNADWRYCPYCGEGGEEEK